MATSATSGGTITDEGSGTIIERGICWSKGITPITSDNRTIEGGGAGTFISNISDLDAATTYYVRTYATNKAGTGYGMAMAFTTLVLPPTNGLVAYYPFNGNANDQTINGNHGIVSGATLTADRFGNPNNAYHFDGINDDITGSVNNWPLYKSPRTISVWATLHTLVGQSSNNFFLTYGQETDNNLNSVYFQYAVGIGKIVVYSGYYNDVPALFDYAFDTWYNILVTFDGTMAAIYINGTLSAQENKNGWNTLPANFHFGNLNNWTSFLNGEVDDIRIYDRVLNQSEIVSLYNEIP